MTDQPESRAPLPEAESTPPQKAPKPDRLEGWHEPPVPEGSSRPVVIGGWYTPEGAALPAGQPPAQDTAPTTPSPSPEPEPPQADAWHKPTVAWLDQLLSGVDETIFEQHHESAAPTPPPDATRPQVVADTHLEPLAAGWSAPQPATPAPPDTPVPPAEGDSADTRLLAASEPEVGPDTSAEQTPAPQPTPLEATSPGLTPAEAALLAEQRGAGEGDFATGDQEPAAAAEASAPVPAPEPSRYEQVEQTVRVLKERFAAGYLTREQLQNELRRLMILGEDGRWWMLGLESQQWYSYDGHNWVPGTPPGYSARIQGSAVRTETGLQEVVTAGPALSLDQAAADSQITLDDEGTPLPRRVPQEDPSATLVSPHTPFLEPVRASEAQTQTRPDEVGEGLTVPSSALAAQATMPGAAVAAQAASGIVLDRPGAAQAPAVPKPRIGEFPQPDYTAALGAEHDRNFYLKWAIRLSIAGIFGSMALTLILLLIMIAYYLNKVDQYAEAVDQLSARAADFENTIIYNARGDVLAEFSNPNTGLRTEVPLPKISPWLIHATVATENETFYTDPGFSVLAIVRAAVQNLRSGDTVSGASTITQQLARALVLETEFAYQRTAERKIVEVIVASEIKRKYSKNEILEIYLNEIFYGNFAYGIEAAARTYFNKPASDLNPIEAAFLAGLPQSPAQYDPVVNREAALRRMNEVLRLMTEANGDGCIYIQHQDETNWAVPSGGGLCFRAEPQPDGSVVYAYRTPNTDWTYLYIELAEVQTRTFSAPRIEFKHPHFVNYVWQQLENTYGPQAIYSAGYRVYTTLDENLQQAAELAVRNNLQRIRDQGYPANNTSVVAIRPSDGAVLAMIGSADYYNEQIKGQVNVAFTAQQPGSALKPFIYLTALQPDPQGRYMTPATVIWDVYTNFNGYEPVNYDRLYHGPKTVREALGNSLNIPAVKALEYVGLLRFTELALRAGITFPGGNPVETNAGLPTALGAQDVRLFDLTAAYAMLANNGRRVVPFTIVYIEDSKGNPIYEATTKQTEQIVSPEYAYLITDILADRDARAEEFGYGWPMELTNRRPAAIKTGTSNDSRDVWALGYTPQLTVGVWVGTTDNEPMYNARGYPTYYLTGYYGAAPVWNEIMESAHAALPVQPFVPPAGLYQDQVCADSGTKPSPGCDGRIRVEWFAQAAPPPPADRDIFRTVEIDTYTNALANDSCRDSVETRVYLAIEDPSAYAWINNTPEGQAWASQRGVQVPIAPPPATYCDPTIARPLVQVTFPPQDGYVQGVLEVRGTVIMPDLNRYELRYGIGHAPETFSSALMMDTFQKPEANALLGQIDTRQLQNGPYTIRVVAIDNAGRSVTRDVRINVSNAAPAEPQTWPTPTLAPTLTPTF